jgi:hypothetical protein
MEGARSWARGAARESTVIATANHYVVDVAVGGLVAALALALASRLDRTVVRPLRPPPRPFDRCRRHAGGRTIALSTQ